MLPFEEFARQRGVEPTALAAALGLPDGTDLSQPIGGIMRQNGITQELVQQAVGQLDPLAAEAAKKNWQKIRLKFILWVLFFLIAMLLLVRTKISPRLRIAALIAAAVVFGVWLGVEPNAPGTIKDGLLLYGETGAIFPPRLIALIGFLLMSIIGNKVFCGWLCQFGTLQDLVSHAPTRKWKPPFWLSNTVRVVSFLTIAVAAVAWAADLLEPVDPFRVFRLGAPMAVGVAVVMLVGGLFIWRPWCNFFCVFGLVSWLGERLSLARVRINHDTCINCHRCEKACGNHSMAQLRARRPLAQDCFACGACIRVCPVNALRWGLKPPAGTDKPPA
ncbi:MAG: 4Fe-4S binding protein [Armatimonadota bacterium]